MNKPFDVEIAIFLKRIFSYYIRKRIPPIPIKDPEVEAEEKWLSNFNQQDSFIFYLDESTRIFLYKDSLLCKVIYSSFEETEICFIKRFLKSGDCFFDIGANIGLFTLHASPMIGKAGHIFAFEPTPTTFARLQNNIDLNAFTNVTLENLGLSNNNDFLQFNVATNGYDAWNSFANLDQLEGEKIIIEVQVNTLDFYIRQKNLSKIDLIKIDVEGWELNVLKGATTLLSRPDSPVLLVEFTETNAFAAGYYCGELFDYVKSFGYEWYSYNKEANALILQHKKLHYPYENLIAIKDLNSTINRLKS